MIEIKGTITIDGVESEFLMLHEHGSWTQWGLPPTQLGPRCQYLDAMAFGLEEQTEYFHQTDDEDENEDYR